MINPFDQASAIKSPRWTLKLALDLIKAMQPMAKPFGYQLMLGGDVLLTGESDKALELYVAPLDTGCLTQDTELVIWLGSVLGKASAIPPPIGNGYPGYGVGVAVRYDPSTDKVVVPPKVYKHKLAFNYDGLRIEVMVATHAIP